jgi:RES domain-containing protein
MSAKDLVRPWRGRVLRHIPGSSPFGPLDVRFAARSRERRWNREGEPALSFASDRAVLIGELARHFECDRDPELASLVQTRRVFELDLELSRVFDLTDAAAVAELGVAEAPSCFLDRAVARATAAFLRDVLGVEAILAPSMVFLDRPEHRNLVVFLDQLASPLAECVHRIEPAGSFQLVPSLPSPEARG